MDITLRQRGGFAGPAFSQQLGPVDADRVEDGRALVAASDFFMLPARLPDGPTLHADAVTYAIRVVDGERRHAVWYDENCVVPGTIRDLMEATVAAGAWRDIPFAVAFDDEPPPLPRQV